jgi:NitT/TauT family transport system ATP-binding protein
VDIPRDFRQRQEDVRSAAEFGALRHQIWMLLRDEVQKAEQQERAKKLGVSHSRPLVPEAGVSAHG